MDREVGDPEDQEEFLTIMSRPEARFRSEHNVLIRELAPISIENALTTPGIGDVSHVNGWVELKIIDKWPVRASTPLRIEHFTDEQRRWSEKWVAAGGNYWLTVKVAREWFIFTVPNSLEVGELTREQMLAKCLRHWKQKPGADELVEVYRKTSNEHS
jgi:hypothetical protein